jgi:hypothetical protein
MAARILLVSPGHHIVDGRRRDVDPAAAHLARLSVERIEHDLPAVHLNPATIAITATSEVLS